MSGTVSVCAATLDVGLNSFNVQLDNGRLSFVAQQKFQGFFAVHEAVLGQAGRTCGLAEDGEICFLVRIVVAVVEAHLVAVEDSCCSLAETVGKFVSLRLAIARVAAPARGIVPFVATAGGVHVDGNETDVPAAQLGANAVDSAAALGERNVFGFWDQQGREVAPLLEFCVHTAGNLSIVRPFKETAVRGTLSCSFLAVSVVDKDFHRTRF